MISPHMLRSDPGWHDARVGKLTASNMWRALDFTKKGESTLVRKKYLCDVVAERMTDIIVPHYVSEAMQWGIDNQALAIAEFEALTGQLVMPEAFFVHPDIPDFGATPDGVYGNTVLEVKCPSTSTHLGYIDKGEIPEEYRYQMAAQMLCTGLGAGMFVSFDPRIRNKAARLKRIEFNPHESFLDQVLSGAVRFLEDADILFERVAGADEPPEM